MATRGPKPKPTALRVLQGNPGRRPLPKHEPTSPPISAVPAAPPWLPELARGKWTEVAAWLVGARILTASDFHNLEAFCSAYARWRDAEAEYAKEGPVLFPADGSPFKNPAATVINESLRQLAQYGGALGLDPSSRARMAAPQDKKQGNRFAKIAALKA